MQILEQSLRDIDMKLVNDNLYTDKELLKLRNGESAKKDATKRTFSRLIASLRAAEAKGQEHVDDLEGRLHDALAKSLKLQDRFHTVMDENRKLKLANVLRDMEKVTTNDKQRLIEAV